MTAVLSIRELTKTYRPGLFEKDVEILRGLNLEVERGEVFGFLGPNGAGKTTTIKAITGIIRPDSGEIRIADEPHTRLSAKRKIGFMPESPYFYNHLTGREYLRFCADLLGLGRHGLEARIGELLVQVGMEDPADRPMRTFSKGMLQRLGLAQALLGSPQLLLLDEPMSGLDPVGRRDVRDLILAERERGTTVFFSTHIIPDVETICDRIAIVAGGTVRATGSVRDLVAHEAESYEATFVGLDPHELGTRVQGARVGTDASWVRVEVADRDALIAELVARGARLVSLTPVRSSLEDFVVRHYREDAP